MENKDKKFVVLEHLQLPNRGFRFWSFSSENNTHSTHGELWYKEILFTDDSEEATRVSRETNVEAIPTHDELEEYWKKQINARTYEELLGIPTINEEVEDKPTHIERVFEAMGFQVDSNGLLTTKTWFARFIASVGCRAGHFKRVTKRTFIVNGKH